MTLLAAFAAVALVMTAVGLYGVISFSVSQSTREIGIRVALGARERDVRMLVLRRAGAVTVTGVAIGLVGATLTARLLGTFLVNVSPSDPVTLLSVTGLFTAVAVLASWLPARRAAAVDPVLALRSE
jgi:ABC-type antimicrobial peptide transport system permease subunit